MLAYCLLGQGPTTSEEPGGKALDAQAPEITRPSAPCSDHRQATSYGAAKRESILGLNHRSHNRLNNIAENPHQPIRRRERIMKRYKVSRQLQRFRFHPRTDQQISRSSPSWNIVTSRVSSTANKTAYPHLQAQAAHHSAATLSNIGVSMSAELSAGASMREASWNIISRIQMLPGSEL